MRKLKIWLDDYAVSHQNPINKKIHVVCVPLIMWSLLGMLWLIPMVKILAPYPWLNGASILVCLTLPFYLLLSIKVAFFMLVLAGLFLLSFAAMVHYALPILPISLSVFILAWIGQFIGHRIEGQKPSFFEDLLFLLIGPIWVLKTLGLNIK